MSFLPSFLGDTLIPRRKNMGSPTDNRTVLKEEEMILVDLPGASRVILICVKRMVGCYSRNLPETLTHALNSFVLLPDPNAAFSSKHVHVR